jgi:two-component system response regulator MprA
VTAPRILVIEDEPGIRDFLEMGLRHEGFEVHAEPNGRAGLLAFDEHRPSLVILDIMLPELDGFEICRRIRGRADTPVIMLTARGDLEARVDGFAAGADDYVPKPFAFDELLARVRAVLRRAGDMSPRDELAFSDLRLAISAHEVSRGSRTLALTAREFDLLALFMRQPRQVLSKAAIMQRVWGADFYGDDNVVEVYVGYLRRKLGEPSLIQTVRGVGYVLREEESQRA